MALGEILIESGSITQEQLDKALAMQREIGGQLGYVLTKLGYTKDEEIIKALSDQLQMPTEMLDGFTPNKKLMEMLPQELLEKHLMIPLRKEGGTLVLGATDPSDFTALDEIRMRANCSVETVLIPLSRARETLMRYYGTEIEEPERPATAQAPSERTPPHLLRSLVRELEREEDIQRIGQDLPAQVESLPQRQLLLAMLDVLLDRGLLTESDLAAALTARQETPEA